MNGQLTVTMPEHAIESAADYAKRRVESIVKMIIFADDANEQFARELIKTELGVAFCTGGIDAIDKLRPGKASR